MISSSSLLESRLHSSTNRSDPDTESKVRSSVRAINDTIQANANEPSLAFFRIQVNRLMTNCLVSVFSSSSLRGTCTKNSAYNGTKTK